MGDATLSLDLADLADRLRAVKDEVLAVTPPGVKSAARTGRDKARENLSRYSHPEKTRTPAPPGAPPALISGHLRLAQQDDGPTALSDAVWSARFGTSSHAGVNHYATHQNHGGPIGAKRRKTLHFETDGQQWFPESVFTPARPWFPSAEWTFRMLMERMAEVWGSVIELG